MALIVSVLTFFLVSPTYATDALALRLTGFWKIANQDFEAKNTPVGEYRSGPRKFLLQLDLKGEGYLSVLDRKAEVNEKNTPALAADRWEGRLSQATDGTFRWEMKSYFKDKDAKGTVIETQFSAQVEFTKGTWEAYEKGEEVELSFSKDTQKKWNDEMNAPVVSLAKSLKETYEKDFPSFSISPVQVEKQGHTRAGRIRGNLKKLSFSGAGTYVVTRTDVRSN